ncbi:Chitin synthase, class 2, partial [Ascosphaera pollenicola]
MGKRKLNESNVPAPEASDAPEAGSPDKKNKQEKQGFDSFNLDSRLMQALTEQKYTKPTLIQSEAIPLALKGKDVL